MDVFDLINYALDFTNISWILGKVARYYTWKYYPRFIYGIYTFSISVNILSEIALISGHLWWFPTQKCNYKNYISDGSIPVVVQALKIITEISTLQLLTSYNVHPITAGVLLVFMDQLNNTFQGWGNTLATYRTDDYKPIVCKKINDFILNKES